MPEDKLVPLFCMVCGDEFSGPEPLMCCSGRDCGCMGMPVEPILCHKKECHDKMHGNAANESIAPSSDNI